MKNTVFILSGPAGVGKTTIWEHLDTSLPQIEKIITTTSRAPREWEKNGKDYYFLSTEAFQKKISENELIEFALVHTNYYGSTQDELERILNHGKSPIYIIEPQGMIHLKPLLEKRGYTVKTIFLLPPSIAALKDRLSIRGTETQEQFEIRIATAISELEQKDLYDFQVVNDSLDEAIESVKKIIEKYAV